MSRYIDFTKPLSEEDKAYLLTRSGGKLKIERNEAMFGHLSDDEKQDVSDEREADKREDEAAEQRQQEFEDSIPEYDEDIIEQVAPLKVAELKKRLDDLGVGYTADDKKEALADLLLDTLQDARDAKENPQDEQVQED